MKNLKKKKRILRISAAQLLLLSGAIVVPPKAAAAAPDPVLEWIGVKNNTVLAAGTSPVVATRIAAMVSGSVSDAVNGIDPRYQPLHVKPNAPHYA